MERRFAARMQEALESAVVDPRMFQDVQPRLENFLEPFVSLLDVFKDSCQVRFGLVGADDGENLAVLAGLAFLPNPGQGLFGA